MRDGLSVSVGVYRIRCASERVKSHPSIHPESRVTPVELVSASWLAGGQQTASADSFL
jgi:hypothetical protein